MTAARVVSVKIYDNTFKKSLRRRVRKLSLLLLKFVVPIIYFVIVESVPVRGGNEFGTCT